VDPGHRLPTRVHAELGEDRHERRAEGIEGFLVLLSREVAICERDANALAAKPRSPSASGGDVHSSTISPAVDSRQT
jgi:hypothetical protein